MDLADRDAFVRITTSEGTSVQITTAEGSVVTVPFLTTEQAQRMAEQYGPPAEPPPD
ncbi:hypothetical protein ACWEJ6_52065 [Nonomuraea sp. NPDC004702]